MSTRKLVATAVKQVKGKLDKEVRDSVMSNFKSRITPEQQAKLDEETYEQELREHPLYNIFMAAIHQAIYGKGERHGGGKTPFMEQDWLNLANNHGRGFLTGQTGKKSGEAASMRQGEAFETEMLGAINYAGMSIIFERLQQDKLEQE